MKPSSIGGPQLDPEYQSPSSPSPSSSSTSPSSSKYKGVRKRKWGKWVSEIRLPNSRERIWLGSYDSPKKAARAFDAALFCLRGRNAKFNFPSSPPDIPNTNNLTQQEIQAMAARFANEHPGSTPEVEAGINDEPKPCKQGGEESGMDWSFLGTLDEIDRGTVSGTGFLYDYDEVDDYLNGTHHLDSNVRDIHGIDDRDNNDHSGGDCVSNDDYTHQTSFLWNF